MKITPLPLRGLNLIESEPFCDQRGRFARMFCARELAEVGLNANVVQANHSVTSRKGSIRGMHFQRSPHAETKIVRCLAGACFDVAVDLRPESETYLQWHGEMLTPDNYRALYIPEGFAHGFQSLEDDTVLFYMVTACYEPSAEGGILYNDPAVNIQWPLAVADISERDQRFPLIGK